MQKHFNIRAGLILSFLFIFLSTLILSPLLTAGPFIKTISFTQPDGAEIQLQAKGDEFYAIFETAAGYRVVFDESAGTYCYATLDSTTGSLISTGATVGSVDPADLQLTPHLREADATVRQQIAQRRADWETQTGTAQRWQSLKNRTYDNLSPNDPGPQMGPPSYTTTGTKVGLCLLIDFDDSPATVPQAEVVQFLNSDNYTNNSIKGSVKQYFLDNSNGQLLYSNVVTVMIRIPNSIHPKSYYNDTTKSTGTNASYLIRDALNILKALPNYATEILPTFNTLTKDADNNILYCNVLYAGDNGGVWGKGLWPMASWLYVVGAQELSPGGLKVKNYQLTDVSYSLDLGTFCHESGHMVCGFPDIYDYDMDSWGGAGSFCIMGAGNNSINPAQFCAYLKIKAGWATVTDLVPGSNVTAVLTASAGTNFNHFYRYIKPWILPSEYFLIENRQPTNRDHYLPGGGIAVWHIDEFGNNSDQSLWPNISHANYEVTLMQADNQWHLQKKSNQGDAQDLYYAGNPAASYPNLFSDATTPSANWWDGTASGLVLSNFSAKADTMTVSVLWVASNSPPVIQTHPLTQTLFTGTNITLQVRAGGSDPKYYQWYQDTALLPGATSYDYAITNAQVSHAGVYFAVVSNAYGMATSYNATISVQAAPSLASALNPNLGWLSLSTKPWTAQTLITHDGSSAARSGSIGDNTNSILQTVLTGPGTLSFWWKVSSEATYDLLSFKIGSVTQAVVSGEVDWQQKTYELPAGSQTLQWIYTKDVNGTNGLDAAFLDQVLFTLSTNAPTILAQPTNQTVAPGGSATFTVTATGNPLTYQWLKNGSPLNHETNRTLTLLNIQPAHAGTYAVHVSNPYSTTPSSNATLTVLTGLTLVEALDAPGLNWTTNGNAAWTAQTTITHDGADAAQSGRITNSQATLLQTTVTGPGTLTFWWKASTETNFDFLTFKIGTVTQAVISGQVNWQQKTFPLGPGTNTLQWQFAKDESLYEGADAAWLDQVTFTPAQTNHLDHPQPAGPHMTLRYSGAPGQKSILLRSQDGTTWTPILTNPIPSHGISDLVDSNAPPSHALYRVRSE
jgi:M6 family metalloprotease-like protein